MGTVWVIYGDSMVIDIIDQLDVIFGSVTSTKIVLEYKNSWFILWLLFRAVAYMSRQTETEISYEFAWTLGRYLPTKNMIENWEDE